MGSMRAARLRRQHGGGKSDYGDKNCHETQRQRIAAGNAVQLAFHCAHQQQRNGQGNCDADARQPQHLEQHHFYYRGTGRSERHADADLAGSLRGRIRQHSVQPNGSHERGQDAKTRSEQCNHAFGSQIVVNLLVHGAESVEH